MHRTVLLSLAFVAGMMSAARADDPPYQPVNLPACRVMTIPTVGQACVYERIADWRLVLEADAELTLRREQAAAERTRADAEQTRADALAEALRVRDAEVMRIQGDLTAERSALIERDRLYQHERNRPRWGSRIAWGIAAIATGAAIALSLAR